MGEVIQLKPPQLSLDAAAWGEVFDSVLRRFGFHEKYRDTLVTEAQRAVTRLRDVHTAVDYKTFPEFLELPDAVRDRVTPLLNRVKEAYVQALLEALFATVFPEIIRRVELEFETRGETP